MGIDKQGEQLEVTVQVALPQASNQNVSNSDALISAKDKTLYGALENLSLQTGWYPKLTFCNLILLDEELVKDDFMPIVDYLLTSSRFQNSAVIACCEKKAKEVLAMTTPLDFISSFALQKILLRNLDRSSSVLVLDVRKFCAQARSPSALCYMPIVKGIQTDDKPKGDSSGGQGSQNSQSLNYPTLLASGDGSSSSSGGGAENGSSNGAGQNKPYLFEASSTIFIQDNKYCLTLISEQTHCYNLLTKEIKEAFIPVNIEKEGKQTQTLISLVTNKPKLKLKINNGKPVVDITLTLTCEKENSQNNVGDNPLKLTNKELDALSKKTTEDINELIALSREKNCDLFGIKELLYQTQSKHYYSFKDDIIRLADYNVKVNSKNYR